MTHSAAIRPPLMVVGAHRSGTSVLVDVLSRLGVFPGARLDPNREAVFFLRLNEWLLRQCGGRWDHPAAVDALLADAELRALAVDALDLAVDGPRARSFLGLGRWLAGRRLRTMRGSWVFKDPRTTFTLPLWLDLFPDARVVHIHRHGVDVAASLVARQVRSTQTSTRLYARNRPLLRFVQKHAGFTDSPRCRTREGAFSLWEEYAVRGRTHAAALGERALEFRFEELAEDPADVVDRLCGFAGIDAPAAQRREAASLLDRDRAHAFTRDPDWASFAERVRDRVEAIRDPDRGAPTPQTTAGS